MEISHAGEGLCADRGRKLVAFETVGSWNGPVKCLVLFLFNRFEFTPINEHPFISFVRVAA